MGRVCKTIGLLDHLGNGNLGDDATFDAVMQNVRRRWPHAAIIGLSLNPHDTARRHGVPSYAIWRQAKARRTPYADEAVSGCAVTVKSKLKSLLGSYPRLSRVIRGLNTAVVRVPKAIAEEVLFLVECLRIAKTLDLLVICGGGQLLDSWGGPWRFPYALFKWIALAKISRGKCYFVNVGAGPLGHPLSKWFVKHALSLADYASFRDAESKALVQTMGFSGGAEVLADNAYGLEALAARGGPTRPAETSSVGISPMAYCHPRRYWDEDQAAYDSLIGKLALFSARLVRSDHRIILFTTDIWFDSVAIDDLTRALTNGANGVLRERIMRPPISEIEDLISHMSQMDYVVTCRYHGVVLAHLMNIPVLALSHHPKIATLMKDLGLSEYCLDIRRFDADLLMERFRRLEDRRDDVKARMARTAADYKRRLTAQFDALFPESMRCGNDSLQRTPGKRTDSRL